MKTVPWITATFLFAATAGCGYIHGWYPGESTSSAPSQNNTSLKCGGPGIVITVTSGTDALPDALPGSATMTNLITNQTSTKTINPMTNTAGSATVIDLACGDVNVKCGLKGYTAVKICGDQSVWQLTSTGIAISGAPFTSD